MKGEWHNVLRIVHLPGGGRAINPPGPEVNIEPVLQRGRELKFQLPSYQLLFGMFASGQLPPIGADFYEMPDQTTGLLPPFWRPFHRTPNDSWPTAKAEDVWKCIAHAGFKSGNMEFSDVTTRISFGVRACSWRLKELSDAYHKELIAICEKGSFKENIKFESLNSFLIYLCTHAMLVELCTLRDYLAEFIAAFVLSDYNPDKNLRIVNLSLLRKHILKIAKEGHPVAAHLYEITDKKNPEGWLASLGAYRDLVVHVVPLVQATHRGFLQQRLVDVGIGDKIPGIYFPIPPDPHAITTIRSKGTPFSTPDDLIKASMDFDAEKESAPDALSYCSFVMGKMVQLLLKVAAFSPLEPNRLQLGPEDIIHIERIQV